MRKQILWTGENASVPDMVDMALDLVRTGYLALRNFQDLEDPENFNITSVLGLAVDILYEALEEAGKMEKRLGAEQ